MLVTRAIEVEQTYPPQVWVLIMIITLSVAATIIGVILTEFAARWDHMINRVSFTVFIGLSALTLLFSQVVGVILTMLFIYGLTAASLALRDGRRIEEDA